MTTFSRPPLSLPHILIPLLLALLIFPASAQSKRVKEDVFTPVRDEMSQMIVEGAAVGLVGAGTIGGKVVFEHAVGMRDREEDAAVKMDTIFRIYSMTKPITCVTALTFFDEKKFKLDDPVSDYLPEFSNFTIRGENGEPDRPLDSPMKVRDLFQHTAGWSYQTPWRMVAAQNGDVDPDLKNMVTALSTMPLPFQPGTQWQYGISNDVLGRMIEVLAQKPLNEVFQERIFDPLKMSDTGFHVDRENMDRLMRMYVRRGNRLVPDRNIGESDPTANPTLLAGGAGLYSTLADYLQFVAMMQGGGTLNGKRILKKKTVALMIQNHIGDIPRNEALLGNKGWGLGVSVVTVASPSGQSIGTWGWGGAAGTSFTVDPKRDEVGIFMNQTWMDHDPAMRFYVQLIPALGKTPGKRRRQR